MAKENKNQADSAPETTEVVSSTSVETSTADSSVEESANAETLEEQLKAKADKYMSENAGTHKMYLTADGFMFLDKKFAKDHAVTIDNKEVFEFERTA